MYTICAILRTRRILGDLLFDNLEEAGRLSARVVRPDIGLTLEGRILRQWRRARGVKIRMSGPSGSLAKGDVSKEVASTTSLLVANHGGCRLRRSDDQKSANFDTPLRGRALVLPGDPPRGGSKFRILNAKIVFSWFGVQNSPPDCCSVVRGSPDLAPGAKTWGRHSCLPRTTDKSVCPTELSVGSQNCRVRRGTRRTKIDCPLAYVPNSVACCSWWVSPSLTHPTL